MSSIRMRVGKDLEWQIKKSIDEQSADAVSAGSQILLCELFSFEKFLSIRQRRH